MKKWKKILALLLVAVMICSSFPVQTKAVEDYRTWSQADERWGSLPLGTSDKTVKSSGCLVTSIAKLMIQCGLKDEADFNPAVLVKWLNNNGGFSGSSLVWAKPAEYVDGFSLYSHELFKSSKYSIDDNTDKIIQHIKDGLHIVLQVKNGGHWVAVDEAMTLANGEIYIMDTLTGKENADIRLKDRYDEFNRAAAYKGGITPDGKPEEEPEEQPEEKPEEQPEEKPEEQPEEKPEEQPFPDVGKDRYSFDAVVWALETGVTTGTNGYFRPEDTCTREEVITFIWRALGKIEATASEKAFPDIKDNYAKEAINWAAENKITTGTNGYFRPEDTCTREEVVTFIWRAVGQPKADSTDPLFPDIKDNYAKEAINWAAENKITTGTNGYFRPEDTCTREEVVTFLYRQFGQKN